MRGWAGDLKIAIRSFMRTPALAGIMVLTLALGIGANAAIFSIVDGVILKDLSYQNADELFWLSQEHAQNGVTSWQYSYAQYRVLSETVETAELAVYTTAAFNLESPEGPVRANAARVSDTFLPLLGVLPAQGRTFTREEEAAQLDLAVISHAFWTDRMGSDPRAIGRSLSLGQESFEIIGVMPPGARIVSQMNTADGAPDALIDLYIPLESFGALQGDMVSTLRLLGRVNPGATAEQARAEVEQVVTTFLSERGAQGWSTAIVSLQDFLVGSSRGPLLILMGSVGVLLVMVCVNLTGLLLVRGVGRSGEWASRRALGASRSRIVRHLLTEGAVLSLVGGLLGLGLAEGVLASVRAVAPAGLPRVEELALDWRAVLFSLALASLTAVLFGMMPALAAARRSPAAALTSSRQTLSSGARKVLKGLVALEVALATVLLTSGGVLLRSLGNLLDQDPGYSAAGVLRGTTDLTPANYPQDADVVRFADQVVERLSGLAGVQSLAISAMPTPTQAPRNVFQIEGLSPEEGRGAALQNAVTPDYFRTLDISLLEGRFFTNADDLNAPGVAIVTKAMAERYFPGESAVGKQVRMGSWRMFNRTGASTVPALREIVGVVEDLSGVGIDPGEPIEMLYSPFSQDPWTFHSYVIRTSGQPGALGPALRSAVGGVDAKQPVFDLETMIDDQREAIGRERLSAQVLGAFAVVALLLSGLGIYGVVAYSVVLRTREIGIRMAVGAEPDSVTRLFFREGLGPVLVGVVAGLGFAFLAVQSLRGLLYQVQPVDPVAFVGAGVLLGLAALASTFLPARRTARIDPVEALRPQ